MTRPLATAALASLVAGCAPEPTFRSRSELDWPGAGEGRDPATFTGRIDVDLCDGEDGDGDGDVDEDCEGPCARFVTRDAAWWAAAACVLDGEATGSSPLPLALGAGEVVSTAAEVQALLAVEPGGDPVAKLRRMLLVTKLNAAVFGIGPIAVVDWDRDGDLEDVDWLVAKAEAHYPSGAAWFQNVLTEQLRELTAVGTGLEPWFDPLCQAPPERCNGADDDQDGVVDEACGCFEACGDGLDDDLDGVADDGCEPCQELVARPWDFWAEAGCAIAGEAGPTLLPLTLGTADRFETADQVVAALVADPGLDSRLRLRRHLLAAHLNQAAFGIGEQPGADLDGDGQPETVAQVIARGDEVYDDGWAWQQLSLVTRLKAINAAAPDAALWFDPACRVPAEVCDGRDNDQDLAVDEACGCVERCDGVENDQDEEVDEDWPEGCPDGAGWRFVSIPDWLNCDVGDLSGLSTWDGGENGTTAAWEDATAFVLDAIAAEAPAFVVVPGDLVYGRWNADADGRMLFGPARTWAEQKLAIPRAADLYFGAWSRRFAERELEVHAGVGDHDLGDNNWAVNDGRSWLLPTWRADFATAFTRLEDATPRYVLRPEGSAWADTAWAFDQGGLRVVMVDAFRQDHVLTRLDDQTGTVLITVDGEQLAWLEGLLSGAAMDPTLDHVLVFGHPIVLGPVALDHSSGLRIRDADGTTDPDQADQGVDTDFWQALAEGGAAAYLAGEVHDVTVLTAEEPGPVQVAHGRHLGRSDAFSYLVVSVWPDHLDLELKEIPLDRSTVQLWQTTNTCSSGEPLIPAAARDQGFQVVGRLRLDRTGGQTRVWDAEGDLVPQPAADAPG